MYITFLFLSLSTTYYHILSTCRIQLSSRSNTYKQLREAALERVYQGDRGGGGEICPVKTDRQKRKFHILNFAILANQHPIFAKLL